MDDLKNSPCRNSSAIVLAAGSTAGGVVDTKVLRLLVLPFALSVLLASENVNASSWPTGPTLSLPISTVSFDYRFPKIVSEIL